MTSAGERELAVIIREAYQHPSQAGTKSFPSRGTSERRSYLPQTVPGYDLPEEEAGDSRPMAVKDWTDDDTEPGDDDAFSPVLHRIISASDGNGSDEDF